MTTTAMAIGGVGTTSSRATVGDRIHRKAEASTGGGEYDYEYEEEDEEEEEAQ